MIEGNGYPHVDIEVVVGMRAQKHHLVVVGEVVVGDGDVCRALNAVDEAIRSVSQEVVIHPQVVRPEDRHRVSVCHFSVPGMRRCAYHLQHTIYAASNKLFVVDTPEYLEIQLPSAAALDMGKNSDCQM